MNAFVKSLLSVLTGGVSNLFTSGSGVLSKVLSNAGDTAADLGQQNLLGNYAAGVTGSRLTDAQREANVWSAQQAELAFNRELDASNTAKQRQVQDYIAAGINPMLAAGQSVSLPSASNAASVSPSSSAFNLPALIELYNSFRLAKAEITVKNAQARNIDADTALKQSQEIGQNFINDVNAATRDVQIEMKSVDLVLLRKNSDKIDSEIKGIVSNIRLNEEQAKSEIEKRALMVAQRVLHYASAYEIRELLGYRKQLMSAQAGQAKYAAALSGIQYVYQKHLITDGYLDSIIDQAAASASIKLDEASLLRIKTALRTGDYSGVSSMDLFNQIFTSEGFLQFATIFMDTFNPLSGLVGISMGQ